MGNWLSTMVERVLRKDEARVSITRFSTLHFFLVFLIALFECVTFFFGLGEVGWFSGCGELAQYHW